MKILKAMGERKTRSSRGLADDIFLLEEALARSGTHLKKDTLINLSPSFSLNTLQFEQYSILFLKNETRRLRCLIQSRTERTVARKLKRRNADLTNFSFSLLRSWDKSPQTLQLYIKNGWKLIKPSSQSRCPKNWCVEIGIEQVQFEEGKRWKEGGSEARKKERRELNFKLCWNE